MTGKDRKKKSGGEKRGLMARVRGGLSALRHLLEGDPKPYRAAIPERYMILVQLFAAMAGEFLIEWGARHSFAEAVTFAQDRTRVFAYNGLLIFMTTLIVFLFRKRRFWRALLISIWTALGITNSVLLANRVTPFTGPDFQTLDEASAVIGKYLGSFARVLIFAAMIALVIFLLLTLIRSPRYPGAMHRVIVIPALLAAFLAFVGVTKYCLDEHILSNYFGNIATAYQDYGFPYCFSVTVLDTGISEPDNYSAGTIQEILDAEGKGEPTRSRRPNVVVVQLESFFDPTRVKWLSFNQDPLPNWHKLTKSYSSGLWTAPTVGAGTVNTEFETLTGMSLRYFGAGEYPYKSVLRQETCESLATVLDSLGYTSHAVHNNQSDFYGRREVYANLGFDTFTPAEYMDTQDDVNENGWMRDENLLVPIGDALDASEGTDFVFTVTVQPHGAYPTEPVIADPKITVSGASSDEKNCAWEYYCNQIHEEDQFIADLIEQLQKRGEPTIVLFYGDHLPTMGLDDDDLSQGSIYDTNYLVWDNLDLEKKDGTLPAYRGVATLLGRIGIHSGVMFRFQQTMAGNPDYLYDMQVLQYDILYGDRYVYGGIEPFDRKDMRLGVLPVLLSRVQNPESEDGVLDVYGSGFTQSCRIEINGELQEDTLFSDSGQLMLQGRMLRNGDQIDVAVQSNSDTHEVLDRTSLYVYTNGTLVPAPPESSKEDSGAESQSSAQTAAQDAARAADRYLRQQSGR